jgi:hypothetical protein
MWQVTPELEAIQRDIWASESLLRKIGLDFPCAAINPFGGQWCVNKSKAKNLGYGYSIGGGRYHYFENPEDAAKLLKQTADAQNDLIRQWMGF